MGKKQATEAPIDDGETREKKCPRLDLRHRIPCEYEGVKLEMGFRAGLIINGCFIVELKSVEKLAPVHAKQLLTYLKLTGFRLGLLINFATHF